MLHSADVLVSGNISLITRPLRFQYPSMFHYIICSRGHKEETKNIANNALFLLTS